MARAKRCHNCNEPKGRHFRKDGALWCPVHGGFMLERYVERVTAPRQDAGLTGTVKIGTVDT